MGAQDKGDSVRRMYAHQDISRDHLTASEVKLLVEVVKSKGGWYSYRNSVLILIIYRHGLRRTEAARDAMV